jgi:hypothetical protein
MKQHALFCAGGRENPEAVRHLQRVGHFEFGCDRRPVNAGDPAVIERILACWQGGDEVEGWARYWSHIYGYMADRLDANPRLREAALVVRFEDLCGTPEPTIRALFEHCRLAISEPALAQLAGMLRSPTYYQPRFSEAEIATIDRRTRTVALRLGCRAPLDAGPVSASA